MGLGDWRMALSCQQQGWAWGCWPITFLMLPSCWQSVKTTCEHPCCFRCSKIV